MGYLSRYSFQDSIRDKATLPLHFEAPTVKLKIDKAAIDEVSKIESVRDQIAELKSRRDVTTDETEREELGEAIQSMAMGWQFRNAESNEVADMRSLSPLFAG